MFPTDFEIGQQNTFADIKQSFGCSIFVSQGILMARTKSLIYLIYITSKFFLKNSTDINVRGCNSKFGAFEVDFLW